MSGPIRVLIADDHPLFRNGLKQLIGGAPGLALAGEAADGEATIRMIREDAPDIAVIDLDMPRMNGLNVARAVRQENLSTDLIILTIYREEDMFNEAMDLGVRGYVLKENAVTDVLACIQAVSEGRYYISPSISHHLLRRSERARTLLSQHPSIESLTPAERRVLHLIADNKTTREIADVLHVSPKTVENHRTHISAKLDLHGTHSLVKFAIENRSAL